MEKKKITTLISFSLSITVIASVIYWLAPNKYNPIIITSALVAVILTILFFVLKRDNEFQKNMILAAGFGVTVVSWFVTGYINNQNEINRNKLISEEAILQKKRELKTKFLIDAFFKIQNADNRNLETSADSYIYEKFAENACSEIQLLGDSNLVRIAQKFALSGGKEYNNTLQSALRDDLREELGVAKLSTKFNPFEFRLISKHPVKDTLTSTEQIDLIIKLNQLNQEFIK